MVDIQTVSIVIASASVVVGVVYYALQIRHQAKMRQTDFIVRLYSTYGSKEFRDMLVELHNLQFNDYKDFEKTYGSWLSKGPAQTAIFVISTYFTEIGTPSAQKNHRYQLPLRHLGLYLNQDELGESKACNLGAQKAV
jgi:hypothetical protein